MFDITAELATCCVTKGSHLTLQQLRQVFEVLSNRLVAVSVHLRVDRQRALVQRLRFTVFSLITRGGWCER